jgi:D-serine deaminase-like pyridoxal phosphate-dependent protein
MLTGVHNNHNCKHAHDRCQPRYAVPISPDKLPQAADLTRRLGRFHVMIDNEAQLAATETYVRPDGVRPAWSAFVMVDCGYHRDGVDPDDPFSVNLVKRIHDSPHHTLAGVYTHGGHSYGAIGAAGVTSIAESERDAVVRFAALCGAAGVPVPTVGVGSTPTCSLPPSSLEGVNEMHPGNFLVYDCMQARIGSCSLSDVATRVATRVIGHYPKQNMLLIDMGWTGCSAQGAEHGYGQFLGHPEIRIKVLKQEAGEVVAADGGALQADKYPIGTILLLLPWHSCAAAHPHARAHAMRGSEIVGTWERVPRGW